jgi:hypothetical protein
MFSNEYSAYKFVKRRNSNKNESQISCLTNDEMFREVPIDCPTDLLIEIEPIEKINTRQSSINNAFFFNFNELQCQDNLKKEQNYDIQAFNEPKKCAVLTKYRSLSTILEEKSINQNSPSIVKENINLKLNDFQLIKALLDDIHVNHLILNEIIRVFQPSSKSGTFQRNIPIRLSSSKAKLITSESPPIKSPRSSLDSSLASKFSPISYTKATSPHKISFNDSIVIDSFEETKRKLRLVKRLKCNIENIKGGSFSNLSTNLDQNNNNNSVFTINIFTNKKNSKVWNQNSLNETSPSSSNNSSDNSNYNQEEHSSTNDYYDLKLNLSSLNDTNIRPYNIRPVYF